VPSHVVENIWLLKGCQDVELSEARMLLADFGEAFLLSGEPECESRTPIDIQPPEARFEPEQALSSSADIWSLACAIWSVISQRSLFYEMWATDDIVTTDQVDALGMLPPEWWSKWEARPKSFNDDGTPTEQHLIDYQGSRDGILNLEDRFEPYVQRPRRDKGMPTFDPNEQDAILVMLRSMLVFRPGDRHSASQVLESEWMQKWALPAYDKMLTLSGEGRGSKG
jgi:serine/threonine protein kinase